MENVKDQRREPRFAANQQVTVTLLRDPQSRMPARVRDSSGRGLGLETPLPIPPGSALKIEIDDGIVLAEAVYCREEQGCCFIGVELNQVLAGLAELGRCLQELTSESRSRSEVTLY
jgi:hypothetical protein